MQCYRWPGHEIRLLGELQRQQNNAQYCDTLLQTEGISVPAHSCILAALSPYLSQKLSASLSPRSGQKRQLQLQAVKAQTLLKLVGLLYSGELVVKGSIEQHEVLSAACLFGITYLVERQEDRAGKEKEPQKRSFGNCRDNEEAGREKNESRKMQDAQVQAEMAGRRETDSPDVKKKFVSIGTQTVKTGEKIMDNYFTHSGQTKHTTPEPASSVAQKLDFSISLQCQNFLLDKPTNHCPSISSMLSGACSDGVSTLGQTFDSVTTPTTPALSSNVMTFPISFNNDSDSPTTQEDSNYQQSSEFGDSIQVSAEEGTGLENRKTAENSENTEWPSHSNRMEMLGQERGNFTKKRYEHEGIKSLVKMKQMQQMMETAQFSVKVKLRRRTKGEVWEVVSMQDTDETFSGLTSLKQDGANHKRPQKDLTNREPLPSSVRPGLVHEPEAAILQPATTNSPNQPPHTNTTFDAQLLSDDRFTPNQNNSPESVPLPQPPGPVEECDEQIEKLLEDIMMGLNILPNFERDCKKSYYLQPNHDEAAAVYQAPAVENEWLQSGMHTAVSTAGCIYDQDVGTQTGHSSTDTGIYCFTAQNQPSCSGPSPVQADAMLIQQRRSPHSSVMWKMDGQSHQGIPLSKSQNCPYPEAPARTPVMALHSSGKKLLTYHPACQEPSPQDNQNIPEFLPLMNENEPLPCMDDLRLPQCLSPLELSTSAVKHQSVCNNSTNQSNKSLPQASLHGRPWLTVNPGPLQFPLSAITHRANESMSSPRGTNPSCWSGKSQRHLLNLQSGGSCEAFCAVKEVEERGAIPARLENIADLKSYPRKMKKSLKCKQGNTEGDDAVPKKRKRGHPQEASSLFAYKHVKASDGTKGQINLSVCSVSLSSNNVLVKEREMATSSSNMLNKFVEKPNEPSNTEGWSEKTKRPGDPNSDQTRTRTFLKKTQETPSKSSIEDFILKPMECRSQIVIKQGVASQGHGMSWKTMLDESLLESAAAKSEVKAIPLKKTRSAESVVEAEGDNNNVIPVIPVERKLRTPKRPRIVTLKEFQKIIRRQHSKTRESKESQNRETKDIVRDVKSEGKACGSTFEELTNKTEMDTDIAQPHNSNSIEDSHVFLSVTVDKNPNRIFKKSTAEYGKLQQDDTNNSTSNETSLFANQSFMVFGEEGDRFAAERKHPLENLEEAGETWGARVTDTTQQTASHGDGSAHINTLLHREDKMPWDHNLNHKSPERTGSRLPDPVALSQSSDCNREEEDEGELEVDVLLYSPEKVPQTGVYENGLNSIIITPEEEEEEDVNEIDVTGHGAE
ncbi:uncharacterized protein LOC121942023 [Plectropomus leopardus]|uniref:uncharacterized protein LOC121942023 n=1 Tax=Plectropomus leopardus TaxID=160734 RepID=UPI001C4D9D67|nr:uncharacterized protein LOC121942023 [Plectropomus leopardus]